MTVCFITSAAGTDKLLPNNELHNHLLSQMIPCKRLWFCDPTAPSLIAQCTHVCFLSCDKYNLDINGFHTFLRRVLLPAQATNPLLRAFNPVNLVF